MVSLALVEDDRNYREELIRYIRKYEEEKKETFAVTAFEDGDEITENYKADYHIILMDIEMKFMDGMTAAETIRKQDSEVIIIFITNMPQYAMKGYTVDALDYLLKPITYYTLSIRLDRALEKLASRTKKYITIPVKGGIQKLDIDKIIYVEINLHDLMFYTVHGEYLTTGSMKKVQENLTTGFYRCNKCYLVNLKFVESVRNYDVVVGGRNLQVSRSRRKGLMEALNKYMNGVMS